jgi:hypothetical protein
MHIKQPTYSNCQETDIVVEESMLSMDSDIYVHISVKTPILTKTSSQYNYNYTIDRYETRANK